MRVASCPALCKSTLMMRVGVTRLAMRASDPVIMIVRLPLTADLVGPGCQLARYCFACAKHQDTQAARHRAARRPPAAGHGGIRDRGCMDEVNVAVMAPILGRDLSFAGDVDARVRVFDVNFAMPGRRASPGVPAAGDAERLAAVLARAEVLLVGYPVPGDLAARSPRLVWAHHTQAGGSNPAGADLGGPPG